MTLTAGARLGPYEIVGPIGAGGMGEVYRARDARLEREVAVKVLPDSVATDPHRLARFEREAKAVAALSHPNILAIHDFGTDQGTPYVVTELLEGESLRERLRNGALPVRKAADYGVQIAQGLAAAHDKGIVHRDLKPENLFVTPDGRVKILDFGLARHAPPTSGEAESTSPTQSLQTQPGTVLGSAGYMSPEQARGLPADPRSDLFSFGAVLYEMLAGRRAFARANATESLAAILKEEPPDLLEVEPSLPRSLSRIVQHCLEKAPAERFQSAHDLVFDLQSAWGPEPGARTRGSASAKAGLSRRGLALLGGLALLAAALGYFAGEARHAASVAAFRQLTFRRGHVTSARFMPDGQTVVYGAAWEGAPIQIHATRLGGAEASLLALPPGDVLSVSRSGELLISPGRRFVETFIPVGRLARAPFSGGAPRELLAEAQEAEWTAEAERLLLVRRVEGKCRIELGAGRVLYETSGWVSDAHLSPRGDLVAFLDHAIRGADNGSVAVIPASEGGKKKTLTRDWPSLQGLAWSPGGREIWFTAAETGWNSALRAVTPDGRERLVARVPGRLRLHEIDPRGRVLATSERLRVGAVLGRMRGGDERDLSWFESSFPSGLSDDGGTVLLSEQGEGAGARYGLYLRDADGSPAARLGDGFFAALSPDARLVATITQDEPPRLAILPTGAGEVRQLPATGVRYSGIAWFPDGTRLVLAGYEEPHASRLYLQDLKGGAPPRPFTPEGFGGRVMKLAVSPDGRFVVANGPGDRPFLCPADGGRPEPLPGLRPDDGALGFSADGRWLFLSRADPPAGIVRYAMRELAGEVLKVITPQDPSGIVDVQAVAVTPDGNWYLYLFVRNLSDLYLVEGLR